MSEPGTIIIQSCWRCNREYSYPIFAGEFVRESATECPYCAEEVRQAVASKSESEQITARIQALNRSLEVFSKLPFAEVCLCRSAVSIAQQIEKLAMKAHEDRSLPPPA